MRTLNISVMALSAALAAGGAWAQESQSGSVSIAPAAAPVEAAIALPIDGTWLTYDVFMAEGDFFPDNWTWTSADAVTVQVTDWAVVTDTFDVFDNGVFAFETLPAAPALNWDDLGFASAFTSPPFTVDPAVAWLNPVFSKGWMSFDPGSHSITVQNTQIPPTDAGGPFPDSTLAIRAVYTPLCDIKPGSFPNSINLKNRGVIPVALLGSENVDVGAVDVTTLMFAGATPDHDLHDPLTYAGHLEDVNLDGYTDLVSHYRTQETNIAAGDTEATITGEIGGVPFSCSDSVRTLHDRP